MKTLITKLLALTLSILMLIPFAASCTETNIDNNDNTADTEKDSSPKASIALDLTKEWETINGENTLVQGCLVINTKFAQEHPNEVAKFLKDYSDSVNTIKSGTDDAIETIVKAKILPNANIAKKALPNCNICYIAGTDMKPVMNTFCEKIFNYDKTSIGGAMPSDSFYYTATGDASAADKELEIKVYALNGTTALGMAQMISNTESDDMNYKISLHTAADAITGAIVSGECAIAALPTNVAVKLFNKSQGKLQLLAINTLGVLYLLENGADTITSLTDLKGKTIYLPGAGSNPEYITAALLESAGLKVGKDVTLDTTSFPSPDELQTAFAIGRAPLAVLPEPKVTVALSKANTQ